MASKSEVTHTESIEPVKAHDAAAFEAPMEHIHDYEDAEHIRLGWRSWMVVFVTCFAIMAQVFVVVAAGSVIAFIIRDLGNPSIAGWIIRELEMSKTINTDDDRGPIAHAECAFTHRRTTERCG
jgi:hypothetical protein